MYVFSIFLILTTGFLIGTILNHLADTLPFHRKLIVNLACSNCGQTFDIYHYIRFAPCKECGVKPSLRRLLTPFISAAVMLIVVFFPPDYSGRWLTIFIFTYLALVLIIDIEHRLIMNPISIIGGIVFIAIGIYLNGWLDTTLGAATGFGFMYALYLLGILFSRWMSKRRGEEIEEIALGFGDVSLSLVIGILIGWPRIALILFFAILLGGVFSGLFLLVSVLFKRYKAFTAIPYAPFIIIATVIVIYASSQPI